MPAPTSSRPAVRLPAIEMPFVSRWDLSYRLCFHLLASLPFYATWFAQPLLAGETVRRLSISSEELLRQAETCEKNRLWMHALDLYAQVMRHDRAAAVKTRHRYLVCLRRLQQHRRHLDPTYIEQVHAISPAKALETYREVLSRLHADYFSADQVTFSKLFRDGMADLRAALEEEAFWQSFGPSTSIPSARELFPLLGLPIDEERLDRLDNVLKAAQMLAGRIHEKSGLAPSALLLELACGACTGLDEYSTYLTPGELHDVCSSWRGDLPSVEPDLTGGQNGRSITGAVSRFSALGAQPGDRFAGLGQYRWKDLRLPISDLLPEKPTSTDLRLARIADANSKNTTSSRFSAPSPSVSMGQLLDDKLGIAYLRILAFQETTLEELDAAIRQLQASGMKSLILDLRGNPGGLFDVAIQIAGRFLSSGLIVSTHGQLREFNQYYYAGGLNVLTVPIVVLVDSETASSAEMLAGALKENQRATLLGQTTFGKGCLQMVQRLTGAASGIRISVAKFYSPQGHAYSVTGLTPDITLSSAEATSAIEQDSQVLAAENFLRSLITER